MQLTPSAPIGTASISANSASYETEGATVSRNHRRTTPEAMQAMVSRDQFEDGLRRLEERVNYDRVRDMEFLMGEMTAVEWRAGKWVDETREAVQLAFLQSDPRFNER